MVLRHVGRVWAVRFLSLRQDTALIAWEGGKREPADRLWPVVINFLGYDPSPVPTSFGDRLRVARRKVGLSQRALAKEIGCDWTTAVGWERGVTVPSPDHATWLARRLCKDGQPQNGDLFQELTGKKP